jgi:hypothetical protein
MLSPLSVVRGIRWFATFAGHLAQGIHTAAMAIEQELGANQVHTEPDLMHTTADIARAAAGISPATWDDHPPAGVPDHLSNDDD